MKVTVLAPMTSRLFPTVETLHILATVWSTLLMINIYLSLRPQLALMSLVQRKLSQSLLFPEHLPPKIVLSHLFFPLYSILTICNNRFDDLVIAWLLH